MAVGHNRSVRVPDREDGGTRQSGTIAAWAIVAQLLPGAKQADARELKTVDAIRHSLAAGVPVVYTGTLPLDTNAEGYLAVEPLRQQSVVLINYSLPRKAFRLVNSRGVGWGQQGRAWVPFSVVVDGLQDGARAMVPRSVKSGG